MSQWDLDTIIRVLQNGAPALFPVLEKALTSLVTERNKLITENAELKKKLESVPDQAEKEG